jgi:hypothetical protein
MQRRFGEGRIEWVVSRYKKKHRNGRIERVVTWNLDEQNGLWLETVIETFKEDKVNMKLEMEMKMNGCVTVFLFLRVVYFFLILEKVPVAKAVFNCKFHNFIGGLGRH